MIFYILLTVHPEEIVGLNQLDAPCSLFSMCFILPPLHVSSDKRSSSGGNKLYQHAFWYNTLSFLLTSTPNSHLASVLYQRMC
jgi:hypothetical protein